MVHMYWPWGHSLEVEFGHSLCARWFYKNLTQAKLILKKDPRLCKMCLLDWPVDELVVVSLLNDR